MTTNKCWKQNDSIPGITEFTLNSWRCFSDFIQNELLRHPDYIFRGHGNANWKLEPTFDRIIQDPNPTVREKHLKKFQYASRARRGTNPQYLEKKNDWWALGQHHGLATPLLDWTESPFVALFFAVTDALKFKHDSNIAIYALWQSGVETINTAFSQRFPQNEKDKSDDYTVKFIRPMSDENNRLVNQRGLFTRGPNNIDLEQWVSTHNHDILDIKDIVLAKLIIPSDDLESCLIYLNRMNILYSTLFPDLYGASKHCNHYLTYDDY